MPTGRAAVHEQARGRGDHVLQSPRGCRPRAAWVRSHRNDPAAHGVAGRVACLDDGAVSKAGSGGGGGGRGVGEPQGDKYVHRGRAHLAGGSQALGECVSYN